MIFQNKAFRKIQISSTQKGSKDYLSCKEAEEPNENKEGKKNQLNLTLNDKDRISKNIKTVTRTVRHMFKKQF